jgi:NTE family protein
MRQHGLNVRRKHVFQVAHTDMAMRRMRAPAIYRPEPLLHLIENFVGDKTFDDLERRLIVNTVDINSGMQVLWGQPGLRDIRVADAVFASCALPGLFPPRQVRGRYYCDGAVLRNLPVRAASLAGEMPVIAVDVGSSSVLRADVENSGFAAAYARGLEIVMHRNRHADHDRGIPARLGKAGSPPGAPPGRARPVVCLRPDPGAH